MGKGGQFWVGIFIFRDNVSNTVLYSEISELNDTGHMESFLRNVVDKFGVPLAIISDMQQSIIESVKIVLPGVMHQFCQSHFLRNVGDALTKELHQELGKQMRNSGVQGEVNRIRKEMKKKR
jgi:transposase-like protein